MIRGQTGVVSALILVALGASICGCGYVSDESMAEQAAWEHHVEEKSIPAADPEPSQAEIDAAIRDTPEFLDRWVCLYDPTMNDDWHDDILCSKGMSAYERPYLLDGDPFVEYDEIMAAASEYEDWLNQNR